MELTYFSFTDGVLMGRSGTTVLPGLSTDCLMGSGAEMRRLAERQLVWWRGRESSGESGDLVEVS
jgi:hypothetical protein